MKNKFFFGVVGFFLVCLFVLFASVVGRAAVLVQVTQPQIAVVTSDVQKQVCDVTVNDVVQNRVDEVVEGEVLGVGTVEDLVTPIEAVTVSVQNV